VRRCASVPTGITNTPMVKHTTAALIGFHAWETQNSASKVVACKVGRLATNHMTAFFQEEPSTKPYRAMATRRPIAPKETRGRLWRRTATAAKSAAATVRGRRTGQRSQRERTPAIESFTLRPNGSRLSCGALKKKVSFNILRASSASSAC